MDVTTTPLAAGIENRNREFRACLDDLSDRISQGEKLTADGALFEQILADELKQASDTSLLSLSTVDDLPAAPPWEPLEAGAIGLLDGGFSQQNGVLYSKAGEMSYASLRLDGGDLLTPDLGDGHGQHPWRVVFDGGLEGSMTAGLYDGRGGQPLGFADGANTPWTLDPLAEPVMPPEPEIVLATEHVFYDGEGRPISLDSLGSFRESLAADGDKIILPDGAVFDYDPWEASIEGLEGAWIDHRSFDGLGALSADIVIEGELV